MYDECWRRHKSASLTSKFKIWSIEGENTLSSPHANIKKGHALAAENKDQGTRTVSALLHLGEPAVVSNAAFTHRCYVNRQWFVAVMA